ncbi:hypothetical protein [Paractinoplanes atraurantiacus]|uniref:Uncharacterized protein n=1 Tax=Paractinoplanes atraurantiacus TaxID=1036182 RepID=A0A285KL09_9ACTN|nr:hypothetical protein [Actinoplanes atraurantiacus]SNY72903.1 hypothetical protein SAMN05421748_14450 [Actinoplanes atraurantiacus]
MDEHDADTERFDQLLERSSLGTPGARRLRRRSRPAQVAAARRIAQLRNRIVHARGENDPAAAAAELLDYLIELGYHGQADHVLYEWFPAEGPLIADMAALTLLRFAYTGTGLPATWQCAHDEKNTKPAGIATLTLAPTSDRLTGADPRWQDEVHLLFTELHEKVGALPVRCRSRADSPPAAAAAAAETFMVMLVFRDTAATVTHLSTCLRHWLDREPGRSLDLAVTSAQWSERIVLHSGGDIWAPTIAGEDHEPADETP